MKVINLDKHDVDICDEYGNVNYTYKASGIVARISSELNYTGYVDGVPTVTRQNEKVINLPRQQEGVMYIVSNVVFNHCSDRNDLLAPVNQVRINGRVVGCRAFISRR